MEICGNFSGFIHYVAYGVVYGVHDTIGHKSIYRAAKNDR